MTGCRAVRDRLVATPDTEVRAADREHLASASDAAQTVKLADLIDNLRSIAEHDPDFATVYFHEKEQLLEVMTGGSLPLREMLVGLMP